MAANITIQPHVISGKIPGTMMTLTIAETEGICLIGVTMVTGTAMVLPGLSAMVGDSDMETAGNVEMVAVDRLVVAGGLSISYVPRFGTLRDGILIVTLIIRVECVLDNTFDILGIAESHLIKSDVLLIDSYR
jgi:hypothetical protein